MTSERFPQPDSKCDNCGEALRGPFCWVCGQKDTHYNRSVFKVIGDFFKEMFDVDSRVFTTLSKLFLRPGTLSIEFRDNKRASYVTPIRLYLFSSLVFFFLFAVSFKNANVQLGGEFNFVGDNSSQANTVRPDEGRQGRTSEEIEEYLTLIRDVLRTEDDIFASARNVLENRIVNLDHDPWCEAIFEVVDNIEGGAHFFNYDLQLIEAIQRAEDNHKRMRVLVEYFPNDSVTFAMGDKIVKTLKHGWLLNFMKATLLGAFIHEASNFETITPLETSLIRLGIHSAYNGLDFVDDIAENLPLMMFTLLPIFVLLLALFNLGKGIRIVFQLIFAMHVHALAFISLTFGILMSRLLALVQVNTELVVSLLTLLILGHVYISFKRFYGSGYIISLLKFTVITFLYTLILTLSLLAMTIYIVVVPFS